MEDSSPNPALAQIIFELFDGPTSRRPLVDTLGRLQKMLEGGQVPASTAIVRALLHNWSYHRGQPKQVGGRASPAHAVFDVFKQIPNLGRYHLEAIAAKLCEHGGPSGFVDWLLAHEHSAPDALLVLKGCSNRPAIQQRAKEAFGGWRAGEEARHASELAAREAARAAEAGGDSIAAALAAYKDGDYDLEDLLEACGVGPTTGGGLVGGGTCGGALGNMDFDPEILEDRVSSDRYEQLTDGAEPTGEEEALFRDLVAERELGGDHAPQFDIWCIRPEHGESHYVVTWRDDAGKAMDFDGPYSSVEEVRGSMREQYHQVNMWADESE